MSNGNGPAYPVQELNGDGSPATLAIGLTKRELFAAMAMQGMLASNFEGTVEMFAEQAVISADALLAQLSKEPGHEGG